MSYDGPRIFQAPYGNQAALENFQRTVVDGVSADQLRKYTDRTFETDRVRLWGTKETVRGKWKGVEPGDFLIFYRNGTYEYAAEVIDTEENEPLGRNVWPNHEEGSPWICVIYLDEPVDLGVDSSLVHELAGYDIDYPMGFSPLNEMGIGGIRGKFGSVEEFVHGSASQVHERDIEVGKQVEARIPESILSGLYFPNGEGANSSGRSTRQSMPENISSSPDRLERGKPRSHDECPNISWTSTAISTRTISSRRRRQTGRRSRPSAATCPRRRETVT